MILAVQYLEPSPALTHLDPAQVSSRLQRAFARLPITHVLIGWDVPLALLLACQDETARARAALWRWQPLLTGDGTLAPRAAWQVVGLAGERVPGFQGMPEFTFMCPNRPAVQEAVWSHLGQLAQSGQYAGFFLDRIRFPSPAADPARWLGCFCPDCCHMAAEEGLDLAEAQRRIRSLFSTGPHIASALQALLDPRTPADRDDLLALRGVLDFRTRSITRFVQAASDIVRQAGGGVGLDCFSPALAYMVGQDLGTLNAHGDWIKLMSYAHALGPAGLPFELLHLFAWAAGAAGAGELEALAWLAAATRLPLPTAQTALREQGLGPEVLAQEVRRGRSGGVHTLLAGIELVEIPGICTLREDQIRADLGAVCSAGVDGLVLSWDLLHMPEARLRLVTEQEAFRARG